MTLDTETTYYKSLYYVAPIAMTSPSGWVLPPVPQETGALHSYLAHIREEVGVCWYAPEFSAVKTAHRNVHNALYDLVKGGILSDEKIAHLNLELIKLDYHKGPNDHLKLNFITRLSSQACLYLGERAAKFMSSLTVTSKELQHVAQEITLLKQLVTLDLHNNKISTLPNLRKLTALQHLYIDGNPLDIIKLKSLIENLPKNLLVLRISTNHIQALPSKTPGFLLKNSGSTIQVVTGGEGQYRELTRDNYKDFLIENSLLQLQAPTSVQRCVVQ